jgi:hypothetical protein
MLHDNQQLVSEFKEQHDGEISKLGFQNSLCIRVGGAIRFTGDFNWTFSIGSYNAHQPTARRFR